MVGESCVRWDLCLWLCLVPSLAWGQTMGPFDSLSGFWENRPLPEQPVRQRKQPEFTPPGVRLGGWVLHPDISLSEKFDDNIDATARATRADLVTSIESGLRLESDWSRHHLDVELAGAYQNFLDHSEQSMISFGQIRATGRLDVSRALTVSGTIGQRWDHEERGSFEDEGASTLTAYRRAEALASLRYQPGRLGLESQIRFDRYDFESGGTAGSAVIDNGDRNRGAAALQLTADWELSPGSIAFVRGIYDLRRYDRTVDDFGDRRDSQGEQIETGVTLDLSHLITLHLQAGAFHRSFDGFRDLPGVVGGIRLVWLPTALTTVALRADHQEVATAIAGASDLLLSRAGLTVDHELRRNIILGASLEIQRGDFVGIDRTDIQLIAGLDVTYNLDRHLYVNGSYGFRCRDSSAAGYDYERNQVLVRVGYRL